MEGTIFGEAVADNFGEAVPNGFSFAFPLHAADMLAVPNNTYRQGSTARRPGVAAAACARGLLDALAALLLTHARAEVFVWCVCVFSGGRTPLSVPATCGKKPRFAVNYPFSTINITLIY